MTTQEFLTQLLAHMGIDAVRIEETAGDDATTYTLLVDENDSGLLIGRHAETIDSLQRITRLVCQKDGDKPIILNVNDFRERREEHVREIADRVAERALETNEAQLLRLPPHERRIVHMHLSTREDVETVSEGEGLNRVLFVKPKTTQPTE